VLAALLANTLLGAWWLDPIVALGISALAVKRVAKPGRRGYCDDCC
jgi:divalent metal cation (Fe/Co/Zn/Cd) transporter